MPFKQLSSRPHEKDKNGWAASIAGNSWWHVKQVEQGSMDMTQSKKHQVEGPIMQAKQ
jgi:hypothetical protein